MTDLPTLKKPVPPIPQEDEEWCLRMVSQEDPNDNRRATLEDVCAVLDAAGYVVSRKKQCEFVLNDPEDPPVRCGKPAVFRREYSCVEHVHVISDPVLIGKLEYDASPSKTSGEAFAESAEAELRKLRAVVEAARAWRRADEDRGFIFGRTLLDALADAVDEIDRPYPKTSGAPDALSGEEEALTSRPAEGRKEPGTVVPEFGKQKKVLEIRFPLGGTPRRATFADLHEAEKKHWISLLPCSECEGPVNDKICVTCFEILEAKTAKLEQAVCEGIAKWDWGVIQKGLHDYQGGTLGGMRVPPEGEGLPPKSSIEFKSKDEMVQWFRDVANAAHLMEGATVGAAKLHERVVALDGICQDAIAGLALNGQPKAAEALRCRLDALK